MADIKILPLPINDKSELAVNFIDIKYLKIKDIQNYKILFPNEAAEKYYIDNDIIPINLGKLKSIITKKPKDYQFKLVIDSLKLTFHHTEQTINILKYLFDNDANLIFEIMYNYFLYNGMMSDKNKLKKVLKITLNMIDKLELKQIKMEDHVAKYYRKLAFGIIDELEPYRQSAIMKPKTTSTRRIVVKPKLTSKKDIEERLAEIEATIGKHDRAGTTVSGELIKEKKELENKLKNLELALQQEILSAFSPAPAAAASIKKAGPARPPAPASAPAQPLASVASSMKTGPALSLQVAVDKTPHKNLTAEELKQQKYNSAKLLGPNPVKKPPRSGRVSTNQKTSYNPPPLIISRGTTAPTTAINN